MFVKNFAIESTEKINEIQQLVAQLSKYLTTMVLDIQNKIISKIAL